MKLISYFSSHRYAFVLETKAFPIMCLNQIRFSEYINSKKTKKQRSSESMLIESTDKSKTLNKNIIAIANQQDSKLVFLFHRFDKIENRFETGIERGIMVILSLLLLGLPVKWGSFITSKIVRTCHRWKIFIWIFIENIWCGFSTTKYQYTRW